MILKALIIDDEYPSRQELRYILEKYNNIEVIGEAAGATEALKLIQALDYDILFIDINLPGINGLDLAAKLQAMPKKPYFIFITAYEDYALRAFDVGAQDYILKPINRSRLKQTIDRIAMNIYGSKPETEPKETSVPAELDKKAANTAAGAEDKPIRIAYDSNGKIYLIDEDEIYFAFSKGDSVYIKTAEGALHTRYTLKELEKRLNSKYFIRTHRSYLVNMKHVKEIKPFFNGTFILVIKDKEKSEVLVSRNQAKKIRELYK